MHVNVAPSPRALAHTFPPLLAPRALARAVAEFNAAKLGSAAQAQASANGSTPSAMFCSRSAASALKDTKPAAPIVRVTLSVS